MGTTTPSEHFDVLIVGAGLSGIGAGFHLQQKCPGKSYVILEGRDCIGGTWDLFRYPGIRSDSDMFTLGYSFKPWTEAKAIADGPRILNYVRETAAETASTRRSAFIIGSSGRRGRRRRRAGPSRSNARQARAQRGDRALHLQFPVHVLRLLQLRKRLFAGVSRGCGFRRPHRASAEMDRRRRLRRQARGGDRLRRHRGDAGAGDGETGRACHHAAALADLCGGAAGAGSRSPTNCAPSCRRSSPITSSAGATCCGGCISSSSRGASRRGSSS